MAVICFREAGAIVNDCIAITTYEFPAAENIFSDEKCNLLTLTTFTSIINTAVKLGYISEKEKKVVLDWNKDAPNWAAKHRIAA